jgi:hypothetical protein
MARQPRGATTVALAWRHSDLPTRSGAIHVMARKRKLQTFHASAALDSFVVYINCSNNSIHRFSAERLVDYC